MEPGFPKEKDLNLAEVARMFAEVGQHDKAVKIAETVKEAESKAWGLSSISGSFLKGKRLDEALKIAQMIGEADSKGRALTSIAKAFGIAGQKDKASDLMRQAQLVAETVADAFRKARALKDLSGGYASLGLYDEALGVVETIPEVDSRIDALLYIASRCKEGGQKKKASEILSQAALLAKSLGPASAAYKARKLADVANAYLEVGEKKQALRLLSEALRLAKEVFDVRSRVDELDNLARSYAAAGLFDRAITVAKMIKANDESTAEQRDGVLERVAQRLWEKGQYDKALRVARDMRSDQSRNSTLAELAGKVAGAGRYAKALRVSKTIDSAGWKAPALIRISKSYLKSGRKVGAAERKILREVVRELE